MHPHRCMKKALTILLSLLGAILALLGLRKAIEGKKPTIQRANTIPPGRTREDGSPIPMGEPDSKGMTQAPVGQLELPGIFEPKTSVGVGSQRVDLPDGTIPSDVGTVVIAHPKVGDVTVEDRSGVTKEELERVLDRYRSR